ncbi:MAG: hypothetical protein ACLUMK_09720 [Christensenellales bacterium]
MKVVWPEEGLGFGIDGCFIPVNAPHAKNANLPPVSAAPGSRGGLRRAALLQPERGGEGLPFRKLPN